MRRTARAAQRGAGDVLAVPNNRERIMTRHPSARRVHRQETAPDDAFVAGVLETTVWAKRHRRTIIIAGVTAAVLIGGLLYWLSYRSDLRERANTELTQVRAVALSGNVPLATRELQQYLDRFGGTPAAREARMLLARVHIEGNQPQQAVDIIRGDARNVRSDMGANAAFLLASAYEAAQELQRAEEVYLRLGDDARFSFQRQEALDAAARIRLQRGDHAGALQLYERLVETTPETSPDRQVFELRLGEARARAQP
jgi:predicted negative regulator of RcsB-dependent stress response